MNGLITEWGVVPAPRGDTLITLDVAYTNSNYSVVLGGGSAASPYYHDINPNSLYINIAGYSDEIRWLLSGY